MNTRDVIENFVRQNPNYSQMNDIQRNIAIQAFVANNNSGNELVRNNIPIGNRTSTGKIYDNGPWTWFAGDIISDVVSDGSPLSRWIPTRAVNYRNETVQHLEWISVKDFDGSIPYRQWLQSQILDDCEIGFSGRSDGFQYTVPSKRMSTSSDTFSYVPDFAGNKEYERSPRFRLRGNNAGLTLDNEADFGVAVASSLLQMHLNNTLAVGLSSVSMQFDGLEGIITSDYISNHAVGSGTATDWARPTIASAANLLNVEDIARLIYGLAAMQILRFNAKQMPIRSGDMALVIAPEMWLEIAKYFAVNGTVAGDATRITGGNTTDAIERRMKLLTESGAYGYGQINVMGTVVDILPEYNISGNSTDKTKLVGDAYLIVKRAGSLTFLEQQYLNYQDIMGAVPYPERQNFSQGGIVRYWWEEYNNSCYRYATEMQGRLVCYMLPAQTKITGISLEVSDLYGYMEGNQFVNPSFPHKINGVIPEGN